MSALFTKNNQAHPTQRGFTLIELLVTITIASLITGIIMVRYSAFDSSVLLKNQTYEIALDLRETQVLGISVRGLGQDFEGNYGIYFNASASPQQYQLFRDNDQNGIFDPTYAVGNPYSLDSRFRINSIHSDVNCSSPELDWATVVFRRPNFDAILNSSSGTPAAVCLQVASVRNPDTPLHVVVYPAGQITINHP